MSDMTSPKVHLIIALTVVVMGAAYLIFLAATWKQLQDDRRASYAKVDTILDRISKAEVKDDVADDTPSG